MKPLTLGKLRGLQQIANPQGIFTITALDHRGSFKRMLQQAMGQGNVDWSTVVAEKERLTRALAPHSSAVLFDPTYGAGPMLARGAVPGNVGLLVAREESGYEGSDESRVTLLQPNWSVAAIKRMGAAAVKLLLYYHPEASSAPKQEEIVRQVAEECRIHDIAFLVEPMSFPLEPGMKKSDPAFAARKPEIVLESARRLVPLGIDVLKAEFPCEPGYETDEGVMRAYCRQLTEIAGVPWVLLSAGVDFATFQRQVEIACEEGASGFLAGRAVWQEGMRMPSPQERQHFLDTIAVSRLRIISDIATYRATPWTERIPADAWPKAEEGWSAAYEEAAHARATPA
ncbi:MAG: DUF2090 domain-containing protein [Caldilineae bacterium]|nr:MAG: DUF2090 domain-containing protein [Caldilineae bacterium]